MFSSHLPRQPHWGFALDTHGARGCVRGVCELRTWVDENSKGHFVTPNNNGDVHFGVPWTVCSDTALPLTPPARVGFALGRQKNLVAAKTRGQAPCPALPPGARERGGFILF